jgi:copper/silver efflux system protein
MVVYLHESLDKRLASDRPLTDADVQDAAIEGAVQRTPAQANDRLRGSRQPDSDPVGYRHRFRRNEANWSSYGGWDDYSTIHVLIVVPVFFVLMKERALRRGTLRSSARSPPK